MNFDAKRFQLLCVFWRSFLSNCVGFFRSILSRFIISFVWAKRSGSHKSSIFQISIWSLCLQRSVYKFQVVCELSEHFGFPPPETVSLSSSETAVYQLCVKSFFWSKPGKIAIPWTLHLKRWKLFSRSLY